MCYFDSGDNTDQNSEKVVLKFQQRFRGEDIHTETSLKSFIAPAAASSFTNDMLNFPHIDFQTISPDPLINHLHPLPNSTASVYIVSFSWQLLDLIRKNQYDGMAFSQIHRIGACNEKEQVL